VGVRWLLGPRRSVATDQRDAATDVPRLRVLTYNTHHGADRNGRLDLEAVASTIAGLHPDVVALQEVDRHWGARSEGVDQPAWYADRLGLPVHFAANVAGRSDSGGPTPEYGLAILSRLPMTLPSHHQYAGSPTHPAEPRGVQQVVVTCPDGGRGRPVRVVNTHLSVAGAWLRRLEVDELLSFVDPADDLATVVAGDFNAGARSREMRSLRRSYQDAWTVGSGPAGTVRSRRRIDYLWVSHHLRPLRTMVVRSSASDHYPVVTDLTWR
jgi:endonuclease/exonuclease/phosphatase family metal-dependent hydrolase